MNEKEFKHGISVLMDCSPAELDEMGEVSEIFKVVETFALAMKIRLLEKYNAGWNGWQDECDWSRDLLARIKGNADTGEMLDVANLAMFAWNLKGRKRQIDMKSFNQEED